MKAKNSIANGTFNYILLMMFIIAANVMLDIALTIQSGNSMKDLIGSSMLDIANTAAEMIDGDTLKELTPDDKGTDKYESIMSMLTYFHQNKDLKYIYCIQDAGDGNFVLGLDPTPYDPGEFGSPIVYTDALYAASQGTPSFDSQYYEDAWGSFYSAYSPVFASDGSVAGIIAVDYSKEWYDAQISSQTNTIIIVNIVSFAISAVMVFFIARSEKKRKTIEEQFKATADIYISMYEISLLNDTYSEIHSIQAAKKNSIIEIKPNASAALCSIYTKATHPSSREHMLEFVDLVTLSDRLKDTNSITNEFLSIKGKWRRARFIVAERTRSGAVSRVIYLVEDIDAEKKERDMTLEAAKLMNTQISSVANVYFSMHDVDLATNTLREIKTHITHISSFFAAPVPNAQQVAFDVVEKTTHESSRRAMHEFVDFSTLEDRFGESNTITEEFLNRDNVWCRARLVISKCDSDGKIEHVLWLIESIDEEKRKRDAISEKAQSLNYQISSISNIYMVVYDVDLIGNSFDIIKSENTAVNDLVGDSREGTQYVVNKVMIAVTDESSLDEALRFVDLTTLEARLAYTNTVTLEILTTTKKWIRIRFLASRRTAFGKLSHVLWLAEDIDKEKRERDKLIDMSERAIAANEAKSSFLSNVSHEIRTPINAVLGMNEMILRECEDDNILAYSDSIRTAGTTLLGLINDILDFSNIEAGKLKIESVEYDLALMLSSLVNPAKVAAAEKRLKFVLDINRSIPKYLRGDAEHLKQIIANLLTNALKYTEKGSVTLCADYKALPDDPGSVILEIAVVDTGIGIKKDDLRTMLSETDSMGADHSFKIEGSGLGISITRRLLEMMDSSLVIESIYGMGSKFSFAVRQTVVSKGELGDYESAFRANTGKHEKYRVKFRAPTVQALVVDDTSIDLKVFKGLLKQTGMNIDSAHSGDEGISLAKHKKYDIIFLDHMMPGKDGIETLHELRSRPEDLNFGTPTICLTANAVSGARDQYISEGFDDYLTKPIDPEILETMLLEYIPAEKTENS